MSVVYLIQAGRYLKIGFTSDLAWRVRSLQTGCPMKLRPRCHFQGTKRDEDALHLALARYRVRGEWFRNRAEVFLAFARYFDVHVDEPAPTSQTLRDAIALLDTGR